MCISQFELAHNADFMKTYENDYGETMLSPDIKHKLGPISVIQFDDFKLGMNLTEEIIAFIIFTTSE